MLVTLMAHLPYLTPEEALERKRQRTMRWYEANKDKEEYKEKRRAWQRANKGKTLAATKSWQSRNPDKVKTARKNYRTENPEKIKTSRRRCGIRTYGITPEHYALMLTAQAGRCAICHKPPGGKQQLGIDHCHTRDHVRGLLCNNCNNGLGRFKDNPDLLRAAADYLEMTLCP